MVAPELFAYRKQLSGIYHNRLAIQGLGLRREINVFKALVYVRTISRSDKAMRGLELLQFFI